MSSIKKLTQKRLFLPIFSMILVMLINVVYDIATGSAPLGFFMISIKNGVLYGRLIDILNRGSEIAILAIGMTLVVSASGGTDISVGSVMSLYAGVCCMILAGYGNVNVQQYAHPLLVGIGAPDILRAEMFAFQRRRRSQSLTRPLALSIRLPL